MRLKIAAIAIAIVGAGALLAGQAEAQSATKKRVVTNNARGQTVIVTRDENGRTRTRVIVERRSYLNPGTERFPGERSDYDYAQLPNQRPTGVLDNTSFGTNQSPLPDLWTLPGRRNPWVGY